MGLYPTAKIIYGLPVERCDPETYEDSILWSGEDDDWKKLPGDLEVRTYGHYDNPDGPLGILTLKRFKTYSADAWTPTAIDARDMDLDELNTYNEAFCTAIEAAGLWEGLPEPHRPTWHLVASYG